MFRCAAQASIRGCWYLRNLVRRCGFSLVELVIVVVIIGVIAAIAVTQLTHASESAQIAALKGNLATLRTAIDLYAADHNGNYPGALTALAKYTSEAGAMSSNPSPTYKFGPYVRVIPPCPIGPSQGGTGWAAANANPPTAVSGFATVGWLYHSSTGGVWVNDINHLDK